MLAAKKKNSRPRRHFHPLSIIIVQAIPIARSALRSYMVTCSTTIRILINKVAHFGICAESRLADFACKCLLDLYVVCLKERGKRFP